MNLADKQQINKQYKQTLQIMLFRKEFVDKNQILSKCFCLQDQPQYHTQKKISPSINKHHGSNKISIKKHSSKSKPVNLTNLNNTSSKESLSHNNSSQIDLSHHTIPSPNISQPFPSSKQISFYQPQFISTKKMPSIYPQKITNNFNQPFLRSILKVHSVKMAFKPPSKNNITQINFNPQKTHQVFIQPRYTKLTSNQRSLNQYKSKLSTDKLRLTKDTKASHDTMAPINSQKTNFSFQKQQQNYSIINKSNYQSQIPFQSQLNSAKLTTSLEMNRKLGAKNIIKLDEDKSYRPQKQNKNKKVEFLTQRVNTIQSQIVEGQESLKGSILSHTFQLKKKEKMSQLVGEKKLGILQIL